MACLLDVAIATQPCLGETVTGDVAGMRQGEPISVCWLVDALGHGREAYASAQVAHSYLTMTMETDLMALMQGLHEQLRPLRGAAVGLLSLAAERICWLGIGNVSCIIWDHQGRQHEGVERAGIVGYASLPTLRQQVIPWQTRAYIMLSSDGMAWDDAPLLPAWEQDAQTTTLALLQRYALMRDDATVMVIKAHHG